MIEKLISDELAKASKKFGGTFASAHEGESVIREEIKEAKEEYNNLKLEFNNVWKAVRSRNTEEQLSSAVIVRAHAKHAIEELIQVCAMCDKFIRSFGEIDLPKEQLEDNVEKRIAEVGAKIIVALDKSGMLTSKNNGLRELFCSTEDACVLCGDYVPEGRWVCPSCEADPFHALKKKDGAL